MAELIRSGPVPLCGAETSSSLQLAHHYGLEASSRCVRSSRRYGVRTPRRSEPGWVQPQLDDFASFALGASLGLATFAKRLRRQAMKKEDWREFRAKLVEQETGATVEVQDEGWLHRGTLLEKGCLLIACPGDRYALDQQYFHKAVILIIKRDQSGDAGVILNRPTRWNLQDADEANLFQAAEGELRRLFGLVREVRPWKVSYGGPMGSTGSNVICLHRSSGLKEGDEVLSGLFLLPFGYARDLVSLGLAPQEDFHLISGYCGWGPGQLEEELRNGSWQLLCADCKAILPSSPTCSPDGIDYWQRFQDALQMTPDEHAAQNAHVGDAALQRWILEHCESTREKRPSREDPMRRIEVASRIQAGTVLRGSASAWILGGSSEMRPRRNEQSRPPAQYLHKAVLLAISDASTEQAPVLVILTGPRVGELPAFGGEEVYFGGLVPSEQQLIQVAGSYIWGQVVFSLPVLEELLQSGALELAPGVRVHEVMSAPRTSRWAAAGGRLESINDAAAALLGDDQQRHWYQRYLGLSVEKL